MSIIRQPSLFGIQKLYGMEPKSKVTMKTFNKIFNGKAAIPLLKGIHEHFPQLRILVFSSFGGA